MMAVTSSMTLPEESLPDSKADANHRRNTRQSVSEQGRLTQLAARAGTAGRAGRLDSTGKLRKPGWWRRHLKALKGVYPQAHPTPGVSP